MGNAGWRESNKTRLTAINEDTPVANHDYNEWDNYMLFPGPHHHTGEIVSVSYIVSRSQRGAHVRRQKLILASTVELSSSGYWSSIQWYPLHAGNMTMNLPGYRWVIPDNWFSWSRQKRWPWSSIVSKNGNHLHGVGILHHLQIWGVINITNIHSPNLAPSNPVEDPAGNDTSHNISVFQTVEGGDMFWYHNSDSEQMLAEFW
jgi:hypothetical protein